MTWSSHYQTLLNETLHKRNFSKEMIDKNIRIYKNPIYLAWAENILPELRLEETYVAQSSQHLKRLDFFSFTFIRHPFER